MGKMSKLRATGTRTSYENGDRKLYDPDKCPDGCDEDVWSLALYFEQLAEDKGWSVEPRPILYTVLYERIRKNFPEVLDRDPKPVVRSSKGVGGKSLYPVDIVTNMIYSYYNNYSSNKLPSINDFSNVTTFSGLKANAVHGYLMNQIRKESAVMEALLDPIQPARQSPLDKATPTCYDGSLSTESLDARLEDFRREYFNELGLEQTT